MPRPVEVNLLPDGIHLVWDDGHRGYHRHRDLRAQCGCAHCVNEMTGQRTIHLQDVRRDVQALDWIQVGRYALQFLWSDFHTTGIYPFDRLRQLCQCDECQSTGASAAPEGGAGTRGEKGVV